MHPIHLAIDTSTARPLVALMRSSELLATWAGPAGTQHSETLLAGIDTCLHDAKQSLNDLMFLSCGVGPGMFTGLRVGVATAQFLADSLGIKVAPISSLLALALQARSLESSFSRVWALNDAKSGRVYALSLRKDELLTDHPPSSQDEIAFEPRELAGRLQVGDIMIGEGALAYRDHWPERVEALLLDPQHVGEIGYAFYKKNELLEPKKILPRYLKTSEEGQKHL